MLELSLLVEFSLMEVSEIKELIIYYLEIFSLHGAHASLMCVQNLRLFNIQGPQPLFWYIDETTILPSYTHVHKRAMRCFQVTSTKT